MPGPREYPPYRRSRIPGELNQDNTPTARPPRGHDDPELARELERAEEERVRILKDAEEKQYRLQRELDREKRKSQVDISIPPPSMRRSHRPAADYIGAGVGGTGAIGALLLALKLFGDQKTDIQDLRTQVTQQATRTEKAEKRAAAWEHYATELKNADDCRFRQVCSALAHLDYGCSDTDYSVVQWSPKDGSWKRNGAPASRAVGECPKVPDPPDE